MNFIDEMIEKVADLAESVLNPSPEPVGASDPEPADTETETDQETTETVEEVQEDPADTTPGVTIVFGSNPPENGICMLRNGGYTPEVHMDKNAMYSVPVLLNGKNVNLQTVLDRLTAVHAALTKHANYSDVSTDAVQVVAITTTAAPSVIGREQNNQWICGSSFDVYFYWR